MMLAVGEGDTDIDYRKAQHALGHGLARTGLDGRDVVAGHCAALDDLHETEAGAPLFGRDGEPQIGELARAAGLLLMAIMDVGEPRDGSR